MARKGMIAGGIVLLVIGAIILIPSFYFYNLQSNNIQQCSTLTGQLDQLDIHNREVCNNAPQFQSAAGSGILLGIVMIVPGIILIVIGAVKESKKKDILLHKQK
jgi:hypothetical protein